MPSTLDLEGVGSSPSRRFLVSCCWLVALRCCSCLLLLLLRMLILLLLLFLLLLLSLSLVLLFALLLLLLLPLLLSFAAAAAAAAAVAAVAAAAAGGGAALMLWFCLQGAGWPHTKGLARIWAAIAGFRVQSASRYTTRPSGMSRVGGHGGDHATPTGTLRPRAHVQLER